MVYLIGGWFKLWDDDDEDMEDDGGYEEFFCEGNEQFGVFIIWLGVLEGDKFVSDF